MGRKFTRIRTIVMGILIDEFDIPSPSDYIPDEFRSECKA